MFSVKSRWQPWDKGRVGICGGGDDGDGEYVGWDVLTLDGILSNKWADIDIVE